MLTFADNPWQVFSTSIAFAGGLLLALSFCKTFHVGRQLSFTMYGWHTILCMAYYYFSLLGPADSKRYYLYSLVGDAALNVGTAGVTYLTSLFSAGLGMSYGGVFLVSNIFGFVGLLAFAGALQEVTFFSNRNVKVRASFILFLPSISYWSSAIGKDSLTFMAAGVTCWGILDARKRLPALILATLAFLVARPHIAGVFLVSLVIPAVLVSKTGLAQKVFLSMILIPVAVAGLYFGLNYAGLGEASDLTDINDYIEKRQGYNDAGGSSIDISSMSLPLQMFAYLFRPLPLEMGGLFGFVAGIENAVLLLLFIIFVRTFVGGRSTLDAFPRLFLLFFSGITLLALAMTTANLGIAMRQKWMFMPMLIVLGFSYIPQDAYAIQRERYRRWRDVRFRHAE